MTPVVVFGRAPRPGAVKTRLVPALGTHGASRLQALMLAHAVHAATRSEAGPVTLCVTPHTEHALFRALCRAAGCSLALQPSGDLGRRMHLALEAAMRGASGALLLGSDCPSLGPAAIAEAARALAGGCDAVLGPTEDGGYALIGLRTPDRALFEGVEWGSPRVLAETRSRLRASGRRWHELAVVHDIDRPEDLECLPMGYLAWASSPPRSARARPPRS